MDNQLDNQLPVTLLTYDAKTDIGKKRETNEDNYLIESWEDKSAILAVVADGMGGHRGGEVASQIAVDTFRELLKNPLPSEASERYELLLKAFYDADSAIREKGNTAFGLLGMGTTIVAAIVTPTELIHLYAGDCRLYHFGGDDFPYMTADHSVVRVLLDLGQITPEQVATHPMRSVVNSCLGGQGNAQFSVDPKWDDSPSVIRKLQAGDLLLLCSDGLHGEISDAELQGLVAQFRDVPEKLTEACVTAALQSGGADNITVIAIRVNEGELNR